MEDGVYPPTYRGKSSQRPDQNALKISKWTRVVSPSFRCFADNETTDTSEKELQKVTFVPKLLTFEEDLMQELGIKEDRKPAKTYWY